MILCNSVNTRFKNKLVCLQKIKSCLKWQVVIFGYLHKYLHVCDIIFSEINISVFILVKVKKNKFFTPILRILNYCIRSALKIFKNCLRVKMIFHKANSKICQFYSCLKILKTCCLLFGIEWCIQIFVGHSNG